MLKRQLVQRRRKGKRLDVFHADSKSELFRVCVYQDSRTYSEKAIAPENDIVIEAVHENASLVVGNRATALLLIQLLAKAVESEVDYVDGWNYQRLSGEDSVPKTKRR